MVRCKPMFFKPLMATILALLSFLTIAKRPEFQIELKNHLFFPAEIKIPENTKVKLIIYNRDQTPEEFDSFDLNREKVIFPEKKSVIFIGPLPSGRYEFFGEFNPNSAKGAIIVVPENGLADSAKLTHLEPILEEVKSTIPSHQNNLVDVEVIYAD